MGYNYISNYRSYSHTVEDVVKFIEKKLEDVPIVNVDFDKVKKSKFNIIMTSYNNPIYIEYQYKLLSKFFKENFSYTVLDCNFNLEECSKLTYAICQRSNINYIKLHDSPFLYKQEGSYRLGANLTWAYKNFIKLMNCPYFGILEQDCFPIDYIDFMSNYLERNLIYGYIYHGIITRGDLKDTNTINWTFNPGLNFFNYNFVKDLDLDFMPDVQEDYYVDTGGSNWHILYKNLNDIQNLSVVAVFTKGLNEQYRNYNLIDCISTDCLDLSKQRSCIYWEEIPSYKENYKKNLDYLYYNGGGFVYPENWYPKWLHILGETFENHNYNKRKEKSLNILESILNDNNCFTYDKPISYNINTLDCLFDEILKNNYNISQIRSEIITFLKFLYTEKTKYSNKFFKYRNILEIGFENGGTSFLFSHLFHNVISIDINNLEKNLENIKKNLFTFNYIKGNSNDIMIYNNVNYILDGDKLDVLFIDGGHAYETITKDFTMYYPLVKTGGFIALHDINPFKNQKEQYGVPHFWTELKEKYKHNFEIIHTDSTFGIGVIIKEDG